MFAILRKDFSAHFAIVASASAAALTALGLLVGKRLIEGDDLLSALRPFVVCCLVPVAWLLVNRLFVTEYTRGEAAFLDRLPLGRGRTFVAKTALGAPLLLVLLALGLSSILSGAQVWNQEFSLEQVARIYGDAAAFLAAAYAALILGATLGRHRHLAWLLAGGSLLLARRAGVSLAELGPLAYLEQDPLTAPPEASFTWLGLAAGLIATAFALTWAGRGRLTRAWRRPCDRRDVLACAVLGALLAGALANSEARQPPFVLDGSVVQASQGGARVTVRDVGPASRALAADLAGALAELEVRLGVSPPSVSIDVSASLSGEAFERASLPGRSGLLLRTGPLQAERDLAPLRAWVLHHALDEATQGRLRRGSWRVILDGYPRWLALQRASPQTQARERLRAAAALSALDESSVPPKQLVERWEDVRLRVGDPLARSLGAWILSLATKDGAHAAARFACDQRRGAFGGLGEGQADLALALREGGIHGSRLQAAAADLLASQRVSLAALPRLVEAGLNLEVGPQSDAGRALVFTPGRAGAGRVALLHALMTRWSDGGVPPLAHREEAPIGADPMQTSRCYPAGARVLWTFATYVPELRCDLVLGWREVDVP